MSPRVALAVAGLVALALPLPAPTILGVGVTGAGVLALGYSVARPGSTAPAVVIAAATISWLVTPPGHLQAGRLALLALAVTVVHSAAALAAVVPPRGRVPAAVLGRWGAWTAGAAGLGIAVVAATALPSGAVPPGPVTVAALAALAIAAAVVWWGARPAAGEAPPAEQ